MNSRISMLLLAIGVLALAASCGQTRGSASDWQQEFSTTGCTMVTTGRNPFFVLEPGYQLVLEGGDMRVHITVLDQTHSVDGILTRVVEEREWKGGKLYEVARNYFAMCDQTKDVFYYGEDVDYYENDKIVRHDGSWQAGRNGSRAGLAMPGSPKLNMKYYQELAPGIAMDRAEVVSLSESCQTRAGRFDGCLKVMEGSALKPRESEYKYYAPGIGLVRDEDLELVRYGFVKPPKQN